MGRRLFMTVVGCWLLGGLARDGSKLRGGRRVCFRRADTISGWFRAA